MLTTIDQLLDDAKARIGAKSERALARALGMDPTSLLQWRRNRAFPSDDRMVVLCVLSGVTPAIGLAYLNVWRSKGQARTAYRVICQKMVSDADLGRQIKNGAERATNKSA